MCVYIYLYTYTYTYIYIVYVCTFKCAYDTYMYILNDIRVCMHICIDIHTNLCIVYTCK